MRPIFKFMFSVSLVLFGLNSVIFYAEPKYTYIKEINLPSPLNQRVIKILNDTDTKSGGLFSRKSLRPVKIVVGELDFWKMAETEILPWKATVTLNSKENWDDDFKLETTILHELGHAYGFWLHDSDPSSIMYYSDSPLINEDSVNKMLSRLKRRGHFL